MLISLLFTFASCFVVFFDIRDSCSNAVKVKDRICLTPEDLETFTFHRMLTDYVYINLYTDKVSFINLSSLRDRNINTLHINSLGKFTLDAKNLPPTLSQLYISDSTLLYLNGPITIDYYIQGNPLIPLSEAKKITKGPNFETDESLEYTFGISNKTSYEASFVTDNCEDYTALYKYKCIQSDQLEKEKFEDFVTNEIKVYVSTDVPSNHPIRFGSSAKDKKLEFIGLNKTQGSGKYKITLDVENWKDDANVSSIAFTNLDLRFNQVSKTIPISDVQMHNMHFEENECSKSVLDDTTLNALFNNAKLANGNVYKCFGFNTKIVEKDIVEFYILDNCEDLDFDPKTGKCMSEAEYSNEMICNVDEAYYTSDHLIKIYIDRSIDKILNLSVCSWKEGYGVPRMMITNLNGVGHPNVTVDFDLTQYSSNAELSCKDITLKVFTKKTGTIFNPFHCLKFLNSFTINYNETNVIKWQNIPTLTYFERKSNWYFFADSPLPTSSIEYERLIIAKEITEECDDYRKFKCITPDQVATEDFTNFIYGYVSPTLYIDLQTSVDLNNVLDLGKLSAIANKPYYIIITGTGESPTLAVKFDTENIKISNLEAYNVKLTLKATKEGSVALPISFKFSNDVVLSGDIGRFTTTKTINSDLRAHYEFFSATFPALYSELDVKSTCGEEYANNFHLKCITPDLFASEDFSDFPGDIGILIFAPITEIIPIDFSTRIERGKIVMQSLLTTAPKQKICLNISNLEIEHSFYFTNLDLSFEIGSNEPPMKFTSRIINISNCTIAQDQCTMVKPDTFTSFKADSKQLYKCFGLMTKEYKGIYVSMLASFNYLVVSPYKVASYNFMEFEDNETIEIYIHENCTIKESFKFNRLKSPKSIKLSGYNNIPYLYWLDIPNMGDYVTSITFSQLILNFNTIGGINSINSNEIVINECQISSDSCHSIQLKEDAIFISDTKETYDCFDRTYQAIYIEESCPNKHIKTGICVSKGEVSTYTFDDFISQNSKELEIVLRTNLDDTNYLNTTIIPSTIKKLIIDTENRHDLAILANNYDVALSLRNLNLKFISDVLKFSSLQISDCSMNNDQCGKLRAPLFRKVVADTLEWYKCLGFNTNPVLIISDSCESYSDDEICQEPLYIDSTYNLFQGAVSIDIQLESSVLSENPLMFDFSQFKMSVSIKPRPTALQEALEVYILADTMENNLESLSMEKVDATFVTTKTDGKVEFNFPVTMKEVNIDESSCNKISISGNVNSDKDLSQCFEIKSDSSNQGDPSKKPLGTGPIIGIVVAVIVVIAVVVGVIIFISKKKENSKEDEEIPL